MQLNIFNRKAFLIAALFFAALSLNGCESALQRGMMGNEYVSTARPPISIAVKNLPLMLAGRGQCNLFWTGMAGGLPVPVWTAVYGTGGLAPLAITAQAQCPQGWQWDEMNRPFSVDQGVEIFNGAAYHASTFIVNPLKSPFGGFVTGVHPDGQPQLWLARSFTARYNFDSDRIIMEYWEPLPDGVQSLTDLPLGQASLLRDFASRAKSAFEIGPPPANPKNISMGYANAVQWQYMDQNFLGSASRIEYWIYR